MKVATFNTWAQYGPESRQPILDQALEAHPQEILCLQEMPSLDRLHRLGYPTLHHSPNHQLAILSTYACLQEDRQDYQCQSESKDLTRGRLCTHLRTPWGPLWVATTHLSWQEDDEPIRCAQVEELLQWAQRQSDPVLLAGDFNAAASATSVQKILQAGWIDLFQTQHPDKAGFTWDNANPFIQSHQTQFPDRRIDFLFLKDTQGILKPIQADVIWNKKLDGMYPSDHYGVSATIGRA